MAIVYTAPDGSMPPQPEPSSTGGIKGWAERHLILAGVLLLVLALAIGYLISRVRGGASTATATTDQSQSESDTDNDTDTDTDRSPPQTMPPEGRPPGERLPPQGAVSREAAARRAPPIREKAKTRGLRLPPIRAKKPGVKPEPPQPNPHDGNPSARRAPPVAPILQPPHGRYPPERAPAVGMGANPLMGHLRSGGAGEGSGVPMRAFPDLRAPVVGRPPFGGTVHVLHAEPISGFYHADHYGQVGYIPAPDITALS